MAVHRPDPVAAAMMRLKQRQQEETMSLLQSQQAQLDALKIGVLPSTGQHLLTSNVAAQQHLSDTALGHVGDKEHEGIANSAPVVNQTNADTREEYGNDEKPLSPAIKDGHAPDRAYEHFVQKALQEENGISSGKDSGPSKKRTFLRKGQGLARFQKGGMAKRSRGVASKQARHDNAFGSPQDQMHTNGRDSPRDNGQHDDTSTRAKRSSTNRNTPSQGVSHRDAADTTRSAHANGSASVHERSRKQPNNRAVETRAQVQARQTGNEQSGRSDVIAHSRIEDDGSGAQGDTASELSFCVSKAQWHRAKLNEQDELDEFCLLEQVTTQQNQSVHVSWESPASASPDREYRTAAYLEQHTAPHPDAAPASTLEGNSSGDGSSSGREYADDVQPPQGQHPAPAVTGRAETELSFFDDLDSWDDNGGEITNHQLAAPRSATTNPSNSSDDDATDGAWLSEHALRQHEQRTVNDAPASPPPTSRLVDRLFSKAQAGNRRSQKRQQAHHLSAVSAPTVGRRNGGSDKRRLGRPAGSTTGSTQSHRRERSTASAMGSTMDTAKRTSAHANATTSDTDDDHSDDAAGVDHADPSVPPQVAALDAEIVKFRSETRQAQQLRQALQHDQRTWEAEHRRMQQQLEQDRASFEREKKEEWSKLKRERKVFQTHHHAARQIPDRRERQEIEKLRQELAAAQDSMVSQERRAKLNVQRLNDKINTLTQQNKELLAEVRHLESIRVTATACDRAPTDAVIPSTDVTDVTTSRVKGGGAGGGAAPSRDAASSLFPPRGDDSTMSASASDAGSSGENAALHRSLEEEFPREGQVGSDPATLSVANNKGLAGLDDVASDLIKVRQPLVLQFRLQGISQDLQWCSRVRLVSVLKRKCMAPGESDLMVSLWCQHVLTGGFLGIKGIKISQWQSGESVSEWHSAGDVCGWYAKGNLCRRTHGGSFLQRRHQAVISKPAGGVLLR
eukprot:m.1304911 g.1304911  ORF g.1304911 m.1304911 type:complete len:963 (-) comp24812_c1_seq23:1354-4242(-)